MNLKIVQGLDSSLSLYSEVYMQSYHSKSLGAYSETMLKHIIPAKLFFDNISNGVSFDTITSLVEILSSIGSSFDNKSIANNDCVMKLKALQQYKTQPFLYNFHRPIRILDICFGLGYNAMLALQVFQNCEIYSPEQDFILNELQSLKYYEIHNAHEILSHLAQARHYKTSSQCLYFLQGNALDIITTFPQNYFDIVFQDAFSQSMNPELWNKKYFHEIFRITAKPCIITTYAKARNILETANFVGFSSFKYKYGSIFTKF